MLSVLRWILRRRFIRPIWRCFLDRFGKLMIGLAPPRIGRFDIQDLETLAQPGDVVLRRYRWYVDNWLIPGAYAHSAIVVSPTEVIHAVAEGVGIQTLGDFVLGADAFLLLRPKYPTDHARDCAIAFAIGCHGKGYDFEFDADTDKELYCHELTAKSLRKGSIRIKSRRGFLTSDSFKGLPKVIKRPMK